MSHVSVALNDSKRVLGHGSVLQAAHVCVLLIYLAHSFLLDETCPLRCLKAFPWIFWIRLFKLAALKICSLHVASATQGVAATYLQEVLQPQSLGPDLRC